MPKKPKAKKKKIQRAAPKKRRLVKARRTKRAARPARPAKRAKKSIPKKVRRPVTKKKASGKRQKAPSVSYKKGDLIGLVTHYFPKVRAAVIKLSKPLLIGQSVKIKGHTTNFTQLVSSMQIDRTPINAAKKGQEIGLLVDSRVRRHDVVLPG